MPLAQRVEVPDEAITRRLIDQSESLWEGKTNLTSSDMVELLKLSSKGQIVTPKAIRNKLNLMEGDRLIVFSKGNLIVLRRIEGEESLLSILSQPLREKFLNLGIKREDVREAVSWTRKGR